MFHGLRGKGTGLCSYDDKKLSLLRLLDKLYCDKKCISLASFVL